MRLLMIHTAGAEGAVALAEEQMIVSEEILPGRSSSELLLPAIRRLMTNRGWEFEGLSAIAVVNGPGSFTGIRVGVSAAKGLSEASGVPLIAVSRLALVAAAVGEEPIFAVLDAGRGEFYVGEYEGSTCVREALMSTEELKSTAGGKRVVVCEAKAAEALSDLAPRLIEEPSLKYALPLVQRRVRMSEFDDAAKLDGNYLRRTDMEIFAKQAAMRAAG